jgi:hypothetical protein
MTSPVEDPHWTTLDNLGVLINFFLFWKYHIPSPHISVPSILLKPLPRKSDFESRVCGWQCCLWNFSFFSLQEKILWPSIWITWRLLRWCSSWLIPAAQYGQALWPFESQIPGSNPGRSTTQQKYSIDRPTHYLQISSISMAYTSIFNLFDNLPRRFLSYYFELDLQWMSRSRCMQEWTFDYSLYIDSCSNSFDVLFKKYFDEESWGTWFHKYKSLRSPWSVP